MKVIPKDVHGVIDYTLAIILLAAPYLFGFVELGGAAVWIPRLIAVMIVGQSLFTDYSLSVAKVIPMKTHILLDYGASLFLALSPFLFGFYGESANVWMPHIAAGLGYFVISLMTKTAGDHSQARV